MWHFQLCLYIICYSFAVTHISPHKLNQWWQPEYHHRYSAGKISNPQNTEKLKLWFTYSVICSLYVMVIFFQIITPSKVLPLFSSRPFITQLTEWWHPEQHRHLYSVLLNNSLSLQNTHNRHHTGCPRGWDERCLCQLKVQLMRAACNIMWYWYKLSSGLT